MPVGFDGHFFYTIWKGKTFASDIMTSYNASVSMLMSQVFRQETEQLARFLYHLMLEDFILKLC